ncbi:hypothetical protein [Mucilaginibacter sp.]
MKKTFLCLLFINFVAFTLVKAQSPNKLAVSLGTDVGFAFENYQANVNFGAKAELPVLPNLKLNFSAAYSTLIPTSKMYTTVIVPVCDGCTISTNRASEPPYHFIPVKAGLRYYYFRHFYVDGDAGAAFKTNYVANTSFIYGFGLGSLIPFNAHNALDFGLNFETGYKTIDYDTAESQLGISLAYRYQF